MRTFSFVLVCLFQLLLIVSCRRNQKNIKEDNSAKIEKLNNAPVQEKAFEQLLNDETISFVYPQNESLYFPGQDVEFFLSSSGASNLQVTVGIDCGGIFNNLVTGMVNQPIVVSVPYTPDSECAAFIIPPPGYISTNLTILIQKSYCKQYFSDDSQTFNSTSPASFTFYNPAHGIVDHFAVLNYSGTSEPLSNMTATFIRKDYSRIMYQSSCNDSNGAYNFNMSFRTFDFDEPLSNCSAYNSNPSKIFNPVQAFRVFGMDAVGNYTIEVTGEPDLVYGRVDSVGMEICLLATYWKLEVLSLYINPGQLLAYNVQPASSLFITTTVNVTLSCSSGNQVQTYVVEGHVYPPGKSLPDSTALPYNFTVPADATGNCTLSAISGEDPSAISPSQLVLVLTNDTVLSITKPESDSPLLIGSTFLVEIASTNTSNPTEINATLTCTYGEPYTASGNTQNGVIMTPGLDTYGICSLRLDPVPGYVSLSNVILYIYREAVLVTPVAGQSLIAAQPFDVLITAYGGLQNSTVGITIGCESGFVYQFNGTLGVTYTPTLNSSAFGECILYARVYDGLTRGINDLVLYAYNPLILDQGLPNPSTGGLTYPIVINSTDGNDYNLTVSVICPTITYSTSGQTNTPFSLTIPSNVNGIACTFIATLDASYEYSEYFTPAQYQFNVLMSPEVENETIARLQVGNFINRNDESDSRRNRLKTKLQSLRKRK